MGAFTGPAKPANLACAALVPMVPTLNYLRGCAVTKVTSHTLFHVLSLPQSEGRSFHCTS